MLDPLPAEVCPDCGDPIVLEVIEEPALFIHGGYGATRRTVVRLCLCGWWLVAEVSEVWP